MSGHTEGIHHGNANSITLDDSVGMKKLFISIRERNNEPKKIFIEFRLAGARLVLFPQAHGRRGKSCVKMCSLVEFIFIYYF